jgi:hypothetical protein
MTLLASRTEVANCTLIAHGYRVRGSSNRDREGCSLVTRPIDLERVAGIEPALSAWEVERARPFMPLSSQPCRSWLTVVNPSSPWLMAR